MPVAVLVVDDDPSFRDTVGELLIVRGFEVAGYAGSEDEAMTAMRRLRPRAVLLDIGLPGRDGFHIARRMSTSDGAPAVLLTSSDSTAANQRIATECGAVGFVPKSKLARTDLRRYFDP